MAIDFGESPFMVIDGITRLTRLKDGQVMCCICMEYRQPSELHVDEDGQRWDVCIGCHAMENVASTTWPG